MYHIYTVWDTLIKFHMYVYIQLKVQIPWYPSKLGSRSGPRWTSCGRPNLESRLVEIRLTRHFSL